LTLYGAIVSSSSDPKSEKLSFDLAESRSDSVLILVGMNEEELSTFLCTNWQLSVYLLSSEYRYLVTWVIVLVVAIISS